MKKKTFEGYLESSRFEVESSFPHDFFSKDLKSKKHERIGKFFVGRANLNILLSKIPEDTAYLDIGGKAVRITVEVLE